ncbi:MAG: hypothetical protein LKF82_09070 [Acinetobacter populi]|jgi:3-hydroxymyristoyl/3-hydroxydecanoyl-(acyl carrier protein) dehydratase|nr:hypothetical protein [Acinetobacter populi]MCH4247971.1 hypothetical protein [Acinetobacter populi]
MNTDSLNPYLDIAYRIATMGQFIPMAQCVAQEADKLQFKAKVNKELLAFEGHFPEFAVFPGVAQIAMVQQIISQYFASLGVIQRIEQLRFQNFILPDQEIFIVLEQTEQSMNFKLTNAAQDVVASGRLFFKDEQPKDQQS